MRYFIFTLLLFIVFSSCQSQPNFSTDKKIKFHDNLFFAEQAEGFVALTKDDKYLFAVDYDSIIPINSGQKYFFKVKKNGKYGLLDFNGIELLYPKYEVLEDLQNKLTGQLFLKAKYKDKWGVLSFFGDRMKEQFVFDEMGDFGDSDRLLLVKKNGKYGFRDVGFSHHGDRDTELKYDFLENYKEGGSKFIRNGKEGKLVISEKTGFLIELYPNENGTFPENKFIYPKSELSVFKKNGKRGLRNKKTKAEVIPAIYDDIYEKQGHTEVVFYAKKNGKRGLLNTKGKEVIPTKYEEVYSVVRFEKRKTPNTYYGHRYSLFYAKDKNGKYGVFDYTGKQLLPVKYDGIYYARGTHLIVKKENLYGLFDTETQRFKLKIEWDKIQNQRQAHNKDQLLIEKDGKKGLADLEGNIMVQPKYSFFYFKENGVTARDASDSLIMLLSHFGDTLSPIYSTSMNIINHHTFSISKDSLNNLGEKVYYQLRLDEKGNPSLPPTPYQIGKEYYNYATVFDTEAKTSGLIHRITGETILPMDYEAVIFYPPFTDRFIAKKDGKHGIIDLSGKFLKPNIYDKVYPFVNTEFIFPEHAQRKLLLKVGIDKKFGVIDHNGEVWIEPKYTDSMKPFNMEGIKDLVLVYNEAGKQGLVKFKLLKEPSEFFDRIFFERGKLHVMKEGKKYPAKITNGNTIEYQ